MQRIKTFFGAATVAIALCSQAAAVTWPAYTYGVSESLANVQGMKRLLQDIETQTKGELTFRFRIAGQLPIRATDITQAVGNGTVRFADDGFHLGAVRIAGIMRLPLLLRSIEDFDKAYAVMQPYIEREFAQHGVVVLGHFTFPHQVIFSRKKLTSLADIKGQKLRVTSPEQAAFISRVGGIPITMGGAEVPSALSAGAIDGALSASAGGGKVWGDVLRNNLRLPVNYFDAFYIVNKRAFDALSPDIQQILCDAVAKHAPQTQAAIAADEIAVTKMLRETGMTITDTTPALEEAATMLTARMESTCNTKTTVHTTNSATPTAGYCCRMGA